MKIGFFDSGLGGKLVMEATRSHLSDYSYCYYGDVAHLPYGDKTESEIYELTKVGVQYLFEQDCVLVVLACNTASAETLRRLQDEWLPEMYPDRRILGVIIPVVEEVVISQCKRVLLLATSRTVSSGKYHLELGKRNVINTKIEAVATPELVPLIEANQLVEAVAAAQEHIDARMGEIDGVILGCTHYSLLAAKLRAVYPNLHIFAQTEEIIPEKLRQYLNQHPEIESQLTREGEVTEYLTI